MQYHRGELVFREQILELGGKKDSRPPPSGSEGGIRQTVDDADALDGLTRSLRRSIERAPTAWAAYPKTSEDTFQLSARSNSIQSRVNQSREEQQVKSFMDGRQQ